MDGTTGLESKLRQGGFVAAVDEAVELWHAAGGDVITAQELLARRLAGEPLAWITGHALFCGLDIKIASGVYVPRWQSEGLAQRASRRLPDDGVAIDVCTGAGAMAKVLKHEHPKATVLATDIDDASVSCARSNGIDAVKGDLFEALPSQLQGSVDVVVAVVPYVPTPELRLLPRDTLNFESTRSYDGGVDGTSLLRRVMTEATAFLKPGGALLVEMGGDQADLLLPVLVANGYGQIEVFTDEDGDVRGLEATLV